MKKYTKADLEQIISVQQENINIMSDLLSILKHQNELLNNTNNKLKDQIVYFKEKLNPTRKRNSNF